MVATDLPASASSNRDWVDCSGLAESTQIWRPDPASARAEPRADDPTFSIIVPTIGRPSLKRALASIAAQIRPGDEIIVICNEAGERGIWGNWAREEGVQRARASHLLFCDDDDVFLPGALDVIRQFAREHPGRIGLFRRRSDAAVRLQWHEPRLTPGGMQSMSFCIPNVPGKVGHWFPLPPDWTDIRIIEEAAREQGAEPIFCDAIVGVGRPARSPWRRMRYAVRLRTRLRHLLGETELPRG